MTIIPVLINGAFGRMGQMTAKAISENPTFELVGQTGREYNLAKSIKDSGATVVIDFTEPTSVLKNTQTIIEAGAHPVIGTTGLKLDEIKSLQKRSQELKRGGIIAPNFSLGAVLMMKYAKEIAKYIKNIEIVEMHHTGKADAPSGTAKRSAELIAEVLHGNNKKEASEQSNLEMPGSRGTLYHGIPIHAVRLPGMLSRQEIIFGEPGETLTLRHDTIDRLCFMPGVFLACEKVLTLDHLVYGLEEIV